MRSALDSSATCRACAVPAPRGCPRRRLTERPRCPRRRLSAARGGAGAGRRGRAGGGGEGGWRGPRAGVGTRLQIGLSYPSAGRGAWRRPRDGGVRRRHRAVSTGRAPRGGGQAPPAGPELGDRGREGRLRSAVTPAGSGRRRHSTLLPRRSLLPFPCSCAGRPSRH